MRKLSASEAKRALERVESVVDLRKVLRGLPPGLEAAAARAILPMLDGAYGSATLLARAAVPLSAAVIRVLLARCAKQRRNPTAVFVREALDATASEASLQGQWAAAVRALQLFDSSSAWGDRALTSKLQAIARDRRLLAATAALVVVSRRPRRNMLAVLAIDGSEVALDALIPHVRRAALRRELASLIKVASPAALPLLPR